MNHLRQGAADYLMIRRALGFKLRGHDRLLEDFLAYVERTGEGTITVQAALSWATAPAELSPVRWAQRLVVVRGFARHLHGLDPAVEVPPVDLIAYRRGRPTPYLYSQQDVERILEVAADLHPALRGATYQTVFGLLAATGMRIGEAIHLDRTDVDLDAGILDINDAKFRKHRRLPLHGSTVTALRQYAMIRDESCPKPKEPSFFVSLRGTRLLDVSIHGVFRDLLQPLGLSAKSGDRHPQIHDLRHTFAVATLREWYRSGADMTGKLPILSAYLGHAEPASTYWYLHACPELLDLAAERLERLEGERR